MQETGTTKQALLNNHKPEPQIKRHSSESATLSTPLVLYCTSLVSFPSWLPTYLA
uniref:Uncharacterized protein n=1 Tax=Mesocestoides corti TaxID=53468 RepID=A0A5K3FXG2_MESCO